MTFLSYAQNFEDVLLRRALHDVERGQYLDIGAQDPIVDSVSLAFYEVGWRGIHVEPTPTYAARLREARPDETVLEVAIATAAGPLEFYEIPGTGLSTGVAEFADRHSEKGFEKRKIVVPSMRLEDLLASVTGDLHWMKIDVEGMEADVLSSWGEHPLRPWVLLIEATFPNSQELCEHLWIDEVLRRGYWDVHFDGLSRYFVHDDHKELSGRFGTPPNVFDGFQVTSTHFSTRTLNEHFRVELDKVRNQAKEREAQLADELIGAQQALEASSEEVREGQAERLALAKALAESEREYRSAIDLMWRERNEIESGLREQLSSAATQMRQDGAELATLRERVARQHDQIEDAQSAAATARKLIDERNQQLANANQVIANALAEPVGSWQRLGRALGFTREDGARRALRSWFANSSIPAISNVETSMSVPSAETGNPYLRANSLPELLAWDDVNFVRCAYVTVLGRQPDPVGEAYYTARVRSGRSKKEILRQLRKSYEGRRHDPGIAGLDRALKAARWQRLNPFRRFAAGPASSPGRPNSAGPAVLSRLEERFLAVEAKIDSMQRSLTFLEGAALRDCEEKKEQKPELTIDRFRQNLAMVATKIGKNHK